MDTPNKYGDKSPRKVSKPRNNRDLCGHYESQLGI